MNNIQHYFFLLFVLGMQLSSQAQETVNSTGGKATGSGGNADYIVGQVTYTTLQGSGGSAAQGVAQAYETSIVTELQEAKEMSVSISVHPNPVSDYLVLSTASSPSETMEVALYDQKGTLLFQQKVNSKETKLPLAHLSPSIYFLRVLSHQDVIKTFKIIKNK